MLRLTGVPRGARPDGEWAPLERRTAALLARLVLDGPLDAGAAARWLWPEPAAPQARSNLRRLRFRLRRLIGVEAIAGQQELRLAGAVPHDLTGSDDGQDAASTADELLAGVEFDDCPEVDRWLGGARLRWRERSGVRLERRLERLEADGRLAEALAVAERYVAVEPTREAPYIALMRLHARRGDPTAALATLARLRRALEPLGAIPTSSAEAMARGIAAGDPLKIAAAPPVTMSRPPRLVGRAADWQALEAAWNARRVLVVSGEPGIGKTRLLGDFALDRPGALCIAARPGDAHVPYAVLARLLAAATGRYPQQLEPWVRQQLARFVPELGDPGTHGVLETLAFQRAVHVAIAGCVRAGLAGVVLDDVHYADDASLDALPLGAADGDARCAWLLGVRGAEMPPALERWLAESGADAALQAPLRVELSALSTATVIELLQSLDVGLDAVRWGRQLARHCGGNPFFILESVRVLADPASPAPPPDADRLAVPGTVARALELRLGRLSPRAQSLVQVAALAGADFTIGLGAEAMGCHPLDLAEVWRELEQAQIIRDGEFAHDLVLHAVLAGVERRDAERLHRAIATRLDADRAPDARVAAHWRAAQVWGRAGERYLAAAAAARRASRRDEQARLLQLAHECFVRDGQREAAFGVLRQRARVALHVERVEHARRLADELVAAAAGDAELARALETRSSVLCELHLGDDALADACRSRELAAASGDREVEMLATFRGALALRHLGRSDEALQLVEPRLADADRVEDYELRLELLTVYGELLESADRREHAASAYQRVHEHAQRHGDLTSSRNALTNRAVSLLFLGRLHESTEALEQARLLTERLAAEKGGAVIDDMTLAGNYRDLGRFDEALRLMLATLDSLRASGYRNWAINQENDLAGLYVWLGQPGRARRVFTPLPDDAPVWARPARLFLQAKLAWEPGARERALLEEALALARQGLGRSYIPLKIELELCRCLDPDEALTAVDRIEHEAREHEQLALAWQAAVYRTEVLLRAGRADQAIAAARRYSEHFERLPPMGLYPPLAWLRAHQAGRAAGDPPLAARAIGRGRQWIERALAHVPAPFRDSFLSHNPVNRALLVTVGERGRA